MDVSSQYAFIPRRGLRSAHAQTIAGNFLPRQNLLPEGDRRTFTVGEHESGARIQVECVCHWQNRSGDREIGSSGELKSKARLPLSSADEPMPRSRDLLTLIIVHGLEGSIESQYVIGTGSKAWAAGMNVVRMNMRNCGNTEALTPTLYHSGLSGDVGAVTEELIREDRLRRVAIAGFSMGGNLVLKLAGEWGDHAPQQVKAFAAVSPAMDLAASADALHSWKNWVYEQKFLRGLQRRFRRKAGLFPDRYDLGHLRRFASIREFDHEITARYEGFAGADDYYHRASSARVVDRIRVPTLIIHAKDDPFIRVLPETAAKLAANPAVRYVETERGGHCAFLAPPNGYDGRWAEKMIVDFVRERGQ
jgi:predicted alpha/beta-fold hydrolase